LFRCYCRCRSEPPAASPASTVSRTTKAVNYRLRNDAVKIDFRGTELMQNASGEAKVTGKKSSVEIEAKFEGLDDPPNWALNIWRWCCGLFRPRGARSTWANWWWTTTAAA